MSNTEKKQRVPAYNLNRIFAVRDRLSSVVVPEFTDKVIEGSTYAHLVAVVYDRLAAGSRKVTCVRHEAVTDSCAYLLGRPHGKKALVELCWRLAANTGRLRKGLPITPASFMEQKQWVPVQIVAGMPWVAHKGKHHKLGHLFRFRCLAGLACPQCTVVFWSRAFQNYLARQIGFTSASAGYHKQNGMELIQLRFLALIEADHTKTGITFQRVYCTSSMKKYNHNIIVSRDPIRRSCPKNFTHNCYRCPIGYAECPLATHPRTYLQALCQSCSKLAYFDPDPGFETNICIRCRSRKHG